jgi:2-polyprenyl-3-methyl-5-hydroxy-6-metoxy-1,4-benzoquinol methylase
VKQRYVASVTHGSASRTSARAEGPDSTRLIEWTGERCVPWVPDTAMLYEHFHRYLWAARIVSGRTVLDLGCGEGFGAAILADSATSVLGLDVDATTISHAVASYPRSNLEFSQADATDLSRFPDGSFSAVIAFEMIEHLVDQERTIGEIERVLTDDGILLISTPDKDLYRDASGQSNAFHERELSLSEFRSLLSRFRHVAVWGQRTITGSYLGAVDACQGNRPALVRDEHAGGDFLVRRSAVGLQQVRQSSPIFCVAIASNARLPDIGRSSTLVDEGLELVHENTRAHAAAVAERDRLLADVNEKLARANLLYGHKHEEVLDLSRRLPAVEAQLLETGEQLNQVTATLAKIEQSVSWQLLQRSRAMYRSTIGGNSRLGRAVSRLLQLVGRQLRRTGAD